MHFWYQHCFFFFQAEDGIRDTSVTGVQTCALPILNKFAGLQSPRVGESEKKYQDDRYQLLRRKSYRVTSQANGRHDVNAVRDAIGQNAHEVRKRYRYRGNCAGLNNEKQRPAKQKTR